MARRPPLGKMMTAQWKLSRPSPFNSCSAKPRRPRMTVRGSCHQPLLAKFPGVQAVLQQASERKCSIEQRRGSDVHVFFLLHVRRCSEDCDPGERKRQTRDATSSVGRHVRVVSRLFDRRHAHARFHPPRVAKEVYAAGTLPPAPQPRHTNKNLYMPVHSDVSS